MMWGREREPGDYCVAHAPNVYAKSSRICRIITRYDVFAMTHAISDVIHNSQVRTRQCSTVQRARSFNHDTRVPDNAAPCSERG